MNYGVDQSIVLYSAPTESGGNFVPPADDAYDLGSSSKAWKDLYLGGLTYTANAFAFQESTTISSTGTLTINAFTMGGTLTMAGNILSDVYTIDSPVDKILEIYGHRQSTAIGIRLWTTGAAAGYANTERFNIDGGAALAEATWSNLTHTGLVITDAASIDTGIADNDYYTFGADDIGVGIVEIGRVSGAAEPWFGIGKDSDVVKATYDDKLGFFSTAPVVKPTSVAVSAGGVHAALVTLGLISGP